MKPKISIIIPVYNVQDYLDECLGSLVCQTFKDFEIVLVNDGSTDNTLSHIQSFAKNDHRAIVINQSNQGVSAARNAALSIAKKEYILCLDGDDPGVQATLKIGEEFGGRDHSTVINACEKVEKLLKTDPNFKQAIDDIKILLK